VEKSIPEAAFTGAGKDRSLWDRFVAEDLTNGEILSVRAFDRDGGLVYMTGREKPDQGERPMMPVRKKTIREIGMAKRVVSVYGNEEMVHAMRLFIPLEKDLRLIGAVEVVQDIEFIYRRVRNVQWGIGMITLALLFILATCLYYVSRNESAALSRENARLKKYDAGVCYRFRDPLACIKGFAMILAEDGKIPETERREFLTTIIGESDRLNRMMDDLLDLERLEGGAIRLNKETVKIDDLIKESVRRVESQAETGRVKVETRLPRQIHAVNVDREKMVQALGNLLIASVMRSMAGGQVSLGAKYDEKGVQFEVADNGEELSGEEIANLFNRFHWVEPGQQKIGTGLELPLAKAIVEAHSSKVNVQSKINEGVKFSFTLPAIG
jgi:signal transduction histidine kinase